MKQPHDLKYAPKGVPPQRDDFGERYEQSLRWQKALKRQISHNNVTLRWTNHGVKQSRLIFRHGRCHCCGNGNGEWICPVLGNHLHHLWRSLAMGLRRSPYGPKTALRGKWKQLCATDGPVRPACRNLISRQINDFRVIFAKLFQCPSLLAKEPHSPHDPVFPHPAVVCLCA